MNDPLQMNRVFHQKKNFIVLQIARKNRDLRKKKCENCEKRIFIIVVA